MKQALPGVLGGRIKWNFTKFLIARDGTPLARFAPLTTPEKMEASNIVFLALHGGDGENGKVCSLTKRGRLSRNRQSAPSGGRGRSLL